MPDIPHSPDAISINDSVALPPSWASTSSSATLHREVDPIDLAKVNKKLESWTFHRNFFESSDHTKETCALNALILSLNMGGDSQDILGRNCETWCEKFVEGASKIDILPIPTRFGSSERSHIGHHTRSLLAELLYLSGGAITDRHMRCSPNSTDFTPSDNLILYGLALDVQITVPPRFPVYNPSQLRDTLLRSALASTEKIRAATEHKISAWVEQLQRTLPIASPDLVYIFSLALNKKTLKENQDIPPEITDRFGVYQRKCFEVFCAQTYLWVPALRPPAYHIFLLLVWSPALTGRELDAICAWANGKAGLEMDRKLRKSLSRPQTPIGIALFIGALTSIEMLKHHEPGEACQSAADGRLSFALLLDGSSSRNAQSDLESMSYIFRTVASVLLDASESQIIGHLLSQHLARTEFMADRVSEKAYEYWEIRLRSSCGHIDALWNMRPSLRRSILENQEQDRSGRRRNTRLRDTENDDIAEDTGTVDKYEWLELTGNVQGDEEYEGIAK